MFDDQSIDESDQKFLKNSKIYVDDENDDTIVCIQLKKKLRKSFKILFFSREIRVLLRKIENLENLK